MKEVPMRLNSLRLMIVAALATAALSACVVAPGPGYGYYGETVYEAPPALQYEAVGIAPAPGYFWIGGGWFWEGGRYAWHPGYWSAPRAGYHWVPRTWGHEGRGWRAREGHWEHGGR
jgi:WXXGXW repeat (2 copies)